MARSRTEAGGICKVAASVATCYAPKDGVPPYAQALIRDNLGFFLIGTPTGIGIVRWQPASSASYEVPGLKSKPGLAGISDLDLAPDGSVWGHLASRPWVGPGPHFIDRPKKWTLRRSYNVTVRRSRWPALGGTRQWTLCVRAWHVYIRPPSRRWTRRNRFGDDRGHRPQCLGIGNPKSTRMSHKINLFSRWQIH